MFEKKFESMLRQYQSSLSEKKKFSGLVKDVFCTPDETKYVNLLLMAYDLGIVEDIANATSINNAFAYKYVKQLMDNYGMSRKNADWVISVWCACYGERVLGKKNEIQVQQDNAGPAIREKADTGRKLYRDNFLYTNPNNGCVGIKGFSGAETSTVILPNKYFNYDVDHIEFGAFASTDIEEVIITEGYKGIGLEVFANCRKLHQVIIPETVTEIYDLAFSGCGSLKMITLPQNIQTIGNRTFEATGLKSITFPESLFFIGDAAFKGCSELDNIVITKNISRISEAMFMNCKALKKITLHDNLVEICKDAFRGCSDLDYIIVPDSVKSIGENAFEGTDKRFIVQCSFGSYAEEYCRKNKIKYQLV